MAPKLVCRIQQNLRISFSHLQMFLYRPFLHYASSELQSSNLDARSYACAAACVNVSRSIVHVTGEMKRRGLLISWFYMYTTFFAIMTLVFFVLENPSSSTSADILHDAYEGKETLASLAKRSMAADRCTITLTVRLRSVRRLLDCSPAEQSLFEQLPGRLNQAGILSILPNKRKAPMGDIRERPNSSPIASKDVSRPTRGAHADVHTQPSILSQSLESSLESHSSARHRGATFEVEGNSHATDDYLHIPSHDYFGPADAVDSPALSAANIRGSSDAIPPSMIASPTFEGTGYASDSANMFYSGDPMSYPQQRMGSGEHKNPIKLEDDHDHDHDWYNRFSSVAESGTSHVQVFGAYPPYPLTGQHSDVHADAQCMYTWTDVHDQKTRNQMAVPPDRAECGWTSHHSRSEILPGMNSHNPPGTEWSSAWIYHGY